MPSKNQIENGDSIISCLKNVNTKQNNFKCHYMIYLEFQLNTDIVWDFDNGILRVWLEEGLITVQAKFNGEVTQASLSIDCGDGGRDATLGADFVLVFVNTVEVDEFDLLDNWCLTRQTTAKLFPAVK